MINKIKYRCKIKHIFLINLCLINKIKVYNLSINEEYCVFYIKKNQKLILENLLNSYKKEYDIINDNSIGSLVKKNIVRYGVYVGIIIAIALLTIWSLTVTDIKIEGNEIVDEGKIISTIEKKYALPTFKSNLDEKILLKDVIAIDGISNASISIKGNVILIEILEELKNPDIIDYTQKSDLISKYDAIITSVNTYSGEARVKVGDSVKKGDVLISHQKTLANGTILESKAMGDVYGRVWITKQLVYTPTIIEKVRTGNKKIYFVSDEKKFNEAVDYSHYEIEISDFYSPSIFPWKMKKIVIYEVEEKERKFDFDTRKESLINAEIMNIEKTLPLDAKKTRWWYFVKTVDKNTVLDLYYEIVVKLT